MAIAPMVRREHERWDGGGYPDGVRAERIPMGSRIIACDAYNAMITARPYRAPMPTEDAVAELRRGAGTQFNPRVPAPCCWCWPAMPPRRLSPSEPCV